MKQYRIVDDRGWPWPEIYDDFQLETLYRDKEWLERNYQGRTYHIEEREVTKWKAQTVRQ